MPGQRWDTPHAAGRFYWQDWYSEKNKPRYRMHLISLCMSTWPNTQNVLQLPSHSFPQLASPELKHHPVTSLAKLSASTLKKHQVSSIPLWHLKDGKQWTPCRVHCGKTLLQGLSSITFILQTPQGAKKGERKRKWQRKWKRQSEAGVDIQAAVGPRPAGKQGYASVVG